MRRDGERGAMLMHAIVMMGLVSLVIAVVAGALSARATAVRTAAASIQATYAAESGIAAAVAALRAGDGSGAGLRGSVARCSWHVVVRGDASAGQVTLESTGECAGRRQRVAYAAAGPGWALRRAN